jgi:hypothetical protein
MEEKENPSSLIDLGKQFGIAGGPSKSVFTVSADWIKSAKAAANSKHLTADEKACLLVGIDLHLKSLSLFFDLIAMFSSEHGDEALAELISESVEQILFTGCELAKYHPPSPSLLKRIEITAKRRSQTENGKKRALQKAQIADETWRPVALKLAVMARKSNPRSSQEDVANYIREHWDKHSKYICPKNRTLISAISNWEHEEKLVRRITQ